MKQAVECTPTLARLDEIRLELRREALLRIQESAALNRVGRRERDRGAVARPPK